jgi:hypothetical protein
MGAYVLLACTVRDGMLLRYTLLSLYVPVGVLTLFFSTRPAGTLRSTVGAAVLLWSLVVCLDHARLAGEYQRHRPVNDFRDLVMYLEANGVHYGYAPYWTSYAVNFLGRERIILASSDYVRIDEHQRLVEAHDDQAIRILFDAPCPNGVAFRRWCLLYLDNARKGQRPPQ